MKINKKKLAKDLLKRDQLTGASKPLYQHIPQLGWEFKQLGVQGYRFCNVRFKDCKLDKYNFKGKSVLDLGCDNGMMMYECFQAGAKRTVGIESPIVGNEASRVAKVIGNTSAEFYKLDLKSATLDGIRSTVKTEKFDVVLYLAMDSFFFHFPEWLPPLVGDMLVYEKLKDNIETQQVVDWLGEYFTSVKVVGQTTDFDGKNDIIIAKC